MIPQQTPDWPCFHFSYFICPSGARKIDQCSGNRRMSSLVLSVLFASVYRESWESGEESGNFVFSQLQSLWCLARFAKLNCTFALCVAIPWRSTEQFSYVPIGCLATLNVPVKQTQSFHAHCTVSSTPTLSGGVVSYLSRGPKGETEGSCSSAPSLSLDPPEMCFPLGTGINTCLSQQAGSRSRWELVIPLPVPSSQVLWSNVSHASNLLNSSFVNIFLWIVLWWNGNAAFSFQRQCWWIFSTALTFWSSFESFRLGNLQWVWIWMWLDWSILLPTLFGGEREKQK